MRRRQADDGGDVRGEGVERVPAGRKRDERDGAVRSCADATQRKDDEGDGEGTFWVMLVGSQQHPE